MSKSLIGFSPMDNRRLLLIIVFVFSLNMLWTAWNRHSQPKLPETPAASSTASSATTTIPAPSAAPGGDTSTVPMPAASNATDYASAPKAIVKTDLMLVEISALGGDITRLELTQHKATDSKDKNFVLFEHGNKHTYLAQTGFVENKFKLPSHKTPFNLAANNVELKNGEKTVQLRMEAPASEGLKVAKILTFTRGSYLIDVAYEIENNTAEPIKTNAYFQLSRDGDAVDASPSFFGGARTFTGAAFYSSEKKYQKTSFTDIEKDKAEHVRFSNDGWVAMVQHYFVSAFVPPTGEKREFFTHKLGKDFYSAGVILPVEIKAGEKKTIDAPLYAGPQEQDKLKSIAPGFDLVVDYGLLTVIAAPLFWVLEWIHRIVGNWGWSIILVTILIKLAFFPLSAASYKSMARMKLLMPRMKVLQERYKDDRMQMNKELMDLYKKEKVNPMGGCLPILVQIPVFIALYWVLLGSVEMRHAPWLGWIQDLSSKDPYFILPIIMGISMIVQARLNPAPPDPIQAKVMMIMPVVFSFMFLWFPSGLVLYWVVNNILSIAQQWSITRMINSGDTKPAKK